jgi:hypothetical protein
MEARDWIEKWDGIIVRRAGRLVLGTLPETQRRPWYKQEMAELRAAHLELLALEEACITPDMVYIWRGVE